MLDVSNRCGSTASSVFIQINLLILLLLVALSDHLVHCVFFAPSPPPPPPPCCFPCPQEEEGRCGSILGPPRLAEETCAGAGCICIRRSTYTVYSCIRRSTYAVHGWQRRRVQILGVYVFVDLNTPCIHTHTHHHQQQQHKGQCR